MSIINIKITILLIIIMVVWVVAYACQEWSSVHRSLRDLTTRLLHYIALRRSTLYYITLHCIALPTSSYITLHCSALQYKALHTILDNIA